MRVLFEFDIALCFYLLIKDFIGASYSGEIHYLALNIIKAFFAIGNLGNPAWFILCILIHYLIAYISFWIFKNLKTGLISVGVLSIVYMGVMAYLLPVTDGRFYNTSICFFFGMLFSFYKERFTAFAVKYYKRNLIVSVCALGGGGC